MTYYLRILCGLLFVALMTACGGGGGSAGVTGGAGGTSGGGGSIGGTATATITFDVVDAAGVATTTVSDSIAVFARAVARDASGAPMSGQVITFTGDALVRFVPESGTALTDAKGLAMVQVVPASSTAAGAGTLKAGATLGGSAVTASTTVQVPSGAGAATLAFQLVDSSGATTTTVGSISPVFLRALTRDGSGNPMAGQLVTFSGSSLVRFVPASGTALTGLNGVATVQVVPASSTSQGAGTVKADTTLAGKALSQSLVFTVPAGVADEATRKVSNFVMLLDKSTLPNAGTATVKLTVVAVDVNNNVVPGAAVSVSTNANSIFTPAGTQTDAQGQFTGTIALGADQTDREVLVSAVINGISRQTTFQITGSAIELTVTPSLLSPAGTSTLNARVLDGAGAPIVGKPVVFSGDIAGVAGRQVNTDINGKVSISFTAPVAVGSYLVKAAASGVTKEISVQVGSSAVIPAAVIPAGAQPSLSAIPNVVSPNAVGSTSNQAQLRFLFLNAQNQPVPNVRVRFEIQSTGLGSFDSSISTGATTVYTNASGVATAAFVPGSTGSPTDGVIVRACYQAAEFTSAVQCVSSVTVRLTIAAQALAVSIGNDNLLTPGPGTYIKQFVVTVADAAGRAVAGAPVDISLDITHYGKGTFGQAITFPLNIGDANTYVPDATTTPQAFAARVSCINEDFNRNGFVDPGENVNGSLDSFGQPTLEPRRSDIILSYVDAAVKTTDSRGILLIKVEHSQRFSTWLSYRIRATTSVAGSQGSAERAFVTTFLEGDEPNGSFRLPPYGTSSCSSPD